MDGIDWEAATNDDSQPSVTNSVQVLAMADAVAVGTPMEEPPSLEAEEEEGEDELEALTKAELEDLLASKDLPTSGTKAELIERLNDAG